MTHAILVTIGAISFWALLSAVSRVLLVNYGLDPWMFSFVQLCAGGIVLWLTGSRSRVDFAGLRAVSTWVLGMFRVISAGLYTSILVSVSVLEAGVLGSMNLPVIACAVWLFLGKRPARFEWAGHLCVLAAIALLALDLEHAVRMTVLVLSALNAVCLAAMTLLAEHHPENASDDPRRRVRFTGTVLLITAALFVLGRYLQHGTLNADTDTTVLIAGCIVGITLRAPAMFLMFWSIRLAGAQGYTAGITLLPIMGMVFEQSFAVAGFLEQSRFRVETLWFVSLVVAGTLMMLAARRYSNR